MMRHQQNLNRGCPTTISIAANSQRAISNTATNGKLSRTRHAPVTKLNNSNARSSSYIPESTALRSRGLKSINVKDRLKAMRPRLPMRASGTCTTTTSTSTTNDNGKPPTIASIGQALSASSDDESVESIKGTSHLKTMLRRCSLTRGPKRSLSLQLKTTKPDPPPSCSATIQRSQSTPNVYHGSLSNKYHPCSSGISVAMPNAAKGRKLQPPLENYRHQDLQGRHTHNTDNNNMKTAFPGTINYHYQIGEMLRHHTHSSPFSSYSEASDAVARLSLDDPLFVNSRGEWTYGLLSGRFVNNGGDTCVIVALDGAGKTKEILKRSKWKSCLRLASQNNAAEGATNTTDCSLREENTFCYQRNNSVPPEQPFQQRRVSTSKINSVRFRGDRRNHSAPSEQPFQRRVSARNNSVRFRGVDTVFANTAGNETLRNAARDISRSTDALEDAAAIKLPPVTPAPSTHLGRPAAKSTIIHRSGNTNVDTASPGYTLEKMNMVHHHRHHQQSSAMNNNTVFLGSNNETKRIVDIDGIPGMDTARLARSRSNPRTAVNSSPLNHGYVENSTARSPRDHHRPQQM